jgi:hypothetical protein
MALRQSDINHSPAPLPTHFSECPGWQVWLKPNPQTPAPLPKPARGITQAKMTGAEHLKPQAQQTRRCKNKSQQQKEKGQKPVGLINAHRQLDKAAKPGSCPAQQLDFRP